MKKIRINQLVEDLYNSFPATPSGIQIPNSYKLIASFLIIVLQFFKNFTNDKVDAMIDEICIELHKLIDPVTPTK